MLVGVDPAHTFFMGEQLEWGKTYMKIHKASKHMTSKLELHESKNSDNSDNGVDIQTRKSQKCQRKRPVSLIFQEALDKARYNFKLTSLPQKAKNGAKKRQRKRPVTWWNPPYSRNVKTSVGKKFFKLLDQHFPQKPPPEQNR